MAVAPWPLIPIGIVSVLMQVICALKLIRAAPQFGRFCINYRRFVFGRLEEDPDNSEISAKMKEVLKRRRLDCARGVAFFLWMLLCVTSLQVVADLLYTGSAMIVDNGIYVRTALLIVFSLPANYPRSLSSLRNAGVLQMIFMALLCMASLGDGVGDADCQRSLLTSTSALVSSFLYLDARVHMFPNMCVTVCMVAGTFLHSQDNPAFLQLLNLQVFTCFARIGVCLCAEYTLVHLVRQEVEASMGRCHHSAVFRLLGMMCDAVVDLDGSLRLKDHYPKLAGLLMHASGGALKGKPLSDFISEESNDRTRFDNAMQQGGMTDETSLSPTMTTLRLRDSIGNRIACALYSVPYRTISGQLHHLVGLREDGDIIQSREGQSSGPEATLREDIARQLREASPALSAPRSAGSRSGSGSLRSRGRLSGGSLRSDVSGPQKSQSAELFLIEGLPIRWIAEELRQDLAVEKITGEDLPEFGDLFSDGGDRLFRAIKDATGSEHVQPGVCRRVSKCLGPWELSARPAGGADPAQQPKAIVTRMLWIQFQVPLQENASSMPYFVIAITKFERTKGGLDTAASPTELQQTPRGAAESLAATSTLAL